jgi:DNA polymerase
MGERNGQNARKLAAAYFEQLSESGETELYVPTELARALRGKPPVAAAPRAEAGAAEDPESSSPGDDGPDDGGKDAGSRGGKSDSSGQSDADMTEVIPVRLAFTTDAKTGDMFSASGAVESCSTLEELEGATAGCTKCELANGRTNIVFGVGNPNARLMFVGEAPGRDEDLQGIPFVGRAGQLLDKILAAAEIERDDVYIANIIKCRPPNNRTPLTNEIESCMPYLGRQVALIRPRIICTLGLPATQTILGIRGSMGSLRGKIYAEGDVRVIPTYHPAAALRDPKYKRPIWDDIRLVKREYEDR